jgi:hypothetical protein
MQPTIGERVAADFSANKVSLSDSEQRRLAAMIDCAAQPRKRYADRNARSIGDARRACCQAR